MSILKRILAFRSRGSNLDFDEDSPVYISVGRRWYKGRVLDSDGNTYHVAYRTSKGPKEEWVNEDRVLTEREKKSISKSSGYTRVSRRR